MEAVGFRVYFDDGANRVEWPGFMKWHAPVDVAASDPLARGVPATGKRNTLTLERGLAEPAPSSFWNWERRADGNFVRKDLTIEVHDGQQTVRTWKIEAAWPMKLEIGVLNATGNEIAIESLELAHEGLSLS